jgi:hypothetical protein
MTHACRIICDYNFPAYDYICWRMVLTDCSGCYCAPFVVAFTLIRKRESDVLIVFTFVIKIANCSVSTD